MPIVASQKPSLNWRSAAIMDCAEQHAGPNGSRRDAMMIAANLIEEDIMSVKRPDTIRARFWGYADLLDEMSTVAPEAHDRIVELLFWSVAPPELAEACCDLLSPMHQVN